MDQTVKRFILICFMCHLSLPLIFSFNEIHASIITEMYEINSIDALKQLYDKSNEYNRRYILKNTPDWFDKNGISEIPDWVYTAIKDAIYSKKALLVMEGIILAGEYGFEEFSERLVDIYKNIYSLHPDKVTEIRCAVVEALMKFGGETAKTYIPELFKHKPISVLKPEFSLLLVGIGKYGDETLFGLFDEIKMDIETKISAIDPKKDIENMRLKYQKVLHRVINLKDNLEKRGGGDE